MHQLQAAILSGLHDAYVALVKDRIELPTTRVKELI